MIPPQGTSVKNPLDIGIASFEGDKFLTIIDLLRNDPKVDALIFLQQLGLFNRFGGRLAVDFMIEMTVKANERLNKPMLVVLEKDDAFGGEQFIRFAEEVYHNKNMATFSNVALASRVVKNLAEYNEYLASKTDRKGY
jgi:acyl-CoA synthetase (NDP forming)